MATPTRPVAGQPIETVWGQTVHDQTFTPKGTRASSASTTGLTATVKLPMTVGGPNLAGGDFVVPEDGLYHLIGGATITALGGAANFRLFFYKNGVGLVGPFGGWTPVTANGAGSYASTIEQLVAGDLIALYATGGSGVTGTTAATGYLQAIKIGDGPLA